MPGDTITGLGEYSIETFQHLSDGVLLHEVGDTIEVRFQRDGESRTVEVTLVSRSSLSAPPQDNADPSSD